MYRKNPGLLGSSHQRNSFASHIASCVLSCGFTVAVHDGNVDLSGRQVVIAPTGVLPFGLSSSTRLIRTQQEQQSIAEVSRRNGTLNAPMYAQPAPFQATATMSAPVPLNSTVISNAANTKFPVAMPIAGNTILPGAVQVAANTTISMANSSEANVSLPGAMPSSANTTVLGISALVPVVSGVPMTENCSNITISPTGCASHTEMWNHWLVVHMAPVLCVFGAMGIAAMQSPKKKEMLQKKPFSWAARAFGLIIAWNLLLMSLPKVGYMLAGCLWSSVSGLTTVLTLAAACVSPVCDFLEIPKMFGDLGCWKTASALLSTGGSGIIFALWSGDPLCAGTFLKLFILCCIDGVIFGLAWLKGEDNMVVAALNMVVGGGK